MSRSVSAPSSVTNTSPCWNGLIVPGSTLMYGSILRMDTFNPRLSSSAPIEADARPLPKDETTPPVTKMNLVRFTSLAISPSPQRCELGARPFEIARRVDLDRGGLDRGDLDAESPFQRAELLELLGLFERRRGELGEAEQEVAAIDIESDVLVPEDAGRRAVAMMRQRTAREEEGIALAIGDDLDHVRVLEFLATADRRADRR